MSDSNNSNSSNNIVARRPCPLQLRRASSAAIPTSPPPLPRSRRASLTFSPSALDMFRLPDAPSSLIPPPPPRVVVSSQPPPPSSLPPPQRPRRSPRLQQQQQQRLNENKKKNPAEASASGGRQPNTKKARKDQRKPPPLTASSSESSSSSSTSSSPNNNNNNNDTTNNTPAPPPCCTICLSNIIPAELATIDGCTHVFCTDCITEWSDQENSCPNCKMRFVTIQNGRTVHPVTPRNQHSDLLETMLGQLASAHYSWTMLNNNNNNTAGTMMPHPFGLPGPLPAGLAGLTAFGPTAAPHHRMTAGVMIGGVPPPPGWMSAAHAAAAGPGGGGGSGASAAAASSVGDTVHSLRLALSLQARTSAAALRVVTSTQQQQQQNVARLSHWLHRHQNGRSYANPIDITDDSSEVLLVD